MRAQHLSNEQLAISGHTGLVQKPAIGTLLIGDKFSKRMPDFYFVEHRRENKASKTDVGARHERAPLRHEFWAATVEFWQSPWVFKTASEFQREFGLLACNFFPMDGSLGYSTWDVKAGTEMEVLQNYLDNDLCRDTENTLFKLNWKPARGLKATSNPQKSTFFVVKHTMYNNAEEWRQFYESEWPRMTGHQLTLGLINHQFRSITQNFMLSTWELKEGVKMDNLQDYLDKEFSRGHLGNEVFQVYGTKNLHPFFEATR